MHPHAPHALCTTHTLAARARPPGPPRRYVAVWISLSALVIMINKYILSFAGMPYPIFLTLTHMALCSMLAATLLFFKVTEPVKLDLTTYIQ